MPKTDAKNSIRSAPIPVGGGLFFVPTDSVTLADMSVDGLLSIYDSMEITAHEFLAPVPHGAKMAGQ